MITLYGMIDSGNCYKPRLLMAHLGIAFRHVETDTEKGQTHTREYLSKNPNGKVPLLELADGRLLAESNAILLYLADGTRFVPTDAYERALVHQWLFFEQYSHEPTVAVRRSLLRYPRLAPYATPEKLAELLKDGTRALRVMEKQLSKTPYLAGEAITVADLALYAYTHDGKAAGFDMEALPAVGAWLDRVASEPGHVPMEWVPRS
jgi:glutathione S-transferase